MGKPCRGRMLEPVDTADPSPLPLDGLIEALGPDFEVEALRRVQALDPHGASGLMPQLLECYAGVMQQQADSLRQGALRADWDQVGRAAHAARSSSLYIGARGFAQACLALEQRASAQTGPGEGCRDQVAALAEWAMTLRARALLGFEVLRDGGRTAALAPPTRPE